MKPKQQEELKDLSSPEDLEGFKKAIYHDHREALLELHRQMEKEVADELSATRMEVERNINNLRIQHEEQYRLMIDRENLLLEQKKREFLNHLVIEQYHKIQEKVFSELQEIRHNSDTYRPLLNQLIREALELLGKEGLILVDRGDSSFVENQDPGGTIRETILDPNGGCIVLEPQEGKVVIDNTLFSRWTRMKEHTLLRIAEQINEIILGQEIQSR
ncbi:MAG: hypothetical protein JW971_01475 [Synergistales bacterium]|nr:hypothetical protein [Synergistales bacterium]